MYVIWYVRVFLGVRGRSRSEARRRWSRRRRSAWPTSQREKRTTRPPSFTPSAAAACAQSDRQGRWLRPSGRPDGRAAAEDMGEGGEGCARERRSVHSQPETPFRLLPLSLALSLSLSLPAAESDCAWRHSPPPPSSRLGLPCRRLPTNGPSVRPSSALFPLKLRALSVSVAVVVVGGAAVDLKNVQTAQQQSACKEAPRSEEGLPRSLARSASACHVRVVPRCLFRGGWPRNARPGGSDSDPRRSA